MMAMLPRAFEMGVFVARVVFGFFPKLFDIGRGEVIDTLKACNLVLERTCKAVALLLDTAEALNTDAEVAA